MSSTETPQETTAKPPELPNPEFPSDAAISAYGALSFLYMHSPRHADWSVRALRFLIQPPIDLKQVRIFTYDGVPRAACLWAHLNDDAEQQLMAGQRLRPVQWRSGRKLWLMEVIAPYEQGTGARAVRAFMDHIPEGTNAFRYARVDAQGKIRRVIESTRLGDNSWGAKIIPNITKRS